MSKLDELLSEQRGYVAEGIVVRKPSETFVAPSDGASDFSEVLRRVFPGRLTLPGGHRFFRVIGAGSADRGAYRVRASFLSTEDKKKALAEVTKMFEKTFPTFKHERGGRYVNEYGYLVDIDLYDLHKDDDHFTITVSFKTSRRKGKKYKTPEDWYY